MYTRAGRETGYWGNYFLRSVRTNGGLETAQRMLRPLKGKAVQKGLQALVDARRLDLCLESLVLQEEFRALFSATELAEAHARLTALPSEAMPRPVPPEELHPETLPEDVTYSDGAVRRVTVNAFERNKAARAACIAKHGATCAVCKLNFEKRYGTLGKGFIHVHHVRPLAALKGAVQLAPAKDLVPICPNCHAMLHRQDPPLSILELREVLRDTG